MSLKVEFADTVKFADIWTYRGLQIPLDEVHVQFATDYANVVLNNFIRRMQSQAATAKKQAEEDAKPLVTLA